MLKINQIFRWAFLLIAVTLFACNNGKKTAKEDTEVLPDDIVELRADQIKLAGIQTGHVEMRSVSGSLKVSGIVAVAPQNLASVCVPMGGFVKSTDMVPGIAVRKGQVIATIQNQDFVDIEQNYLEAKNKLEFAEANYNRHSELYKDNVYSQENMQQVTSDYKSLKAQVKALAEKLTLIGINPASLKEDNISGTIAVVSPISGFVKTVNVNLGKFVSPTDVLFEIVNSDKLFLELSLFEKDADKVSVGQKIRFFVNNEDEQHKAQVYQASKSVNADRSCKVYASVTDVCKNIFPGMYVNAMIDAAGGDVTALPEEAVVTFDDKSYIFVYERDKNENGKAFTEYKMVEVKKGVSDGSFVEIILPQGFETQSAKVVKKGAYNLLSAKKNAGEMAC